MKALLVARLTFREVLSKRILAGCLVLSAAFLLLYGLGVHYAFQELEASAGGGFYGSISAEEYLSYQAALFLMMGVYVASFIGALLAIFSTVGAISTEAENGTLQAIVAKPLRRRDLILGKGLGYAAMLSLYLLGLFFSLVAIVYWQSGWFPPNALMSGLTFVFQAIILLSVALLGSTRLSTITNGVVVFMLYASALIGGMIEQIGGLIESDKLVQTGIVASLLMPSDSLYRYTVHLLRPQLSSALTMATGSFGFGPFGAVTTPSVWMLLWAATYTIAALSLAIRSFNRRDL